MHLKSLNIGRLEANPAKRGLATAMDKRPVSEPVWVRAPGSKRDGLGSGLVGDQIGDREHHGGDDQAVYAVAREELDWWSVELGRDLADGAFGENLTTVGVAVDEALIGEQWRIGPSAASLGPDGGPRGCLLRVRVPRIACGTFASAMGEKGWLPRFNAHGRSGAYLEVIEPGWIEAGDQIQVVARPDHGVSVALTFAALTTRPELVPQLAQAGDHLTAQLRTRVLAAPPFGE